MPDFVSDIFAVFEGVPVFFVLSGFLMWKSIEHTKDFTAFCKKRILRLYPELWGGVLINFILIIMLYGSQIEWIPYIGFQFTQGTFLQFWTPGCLRGYGCGTPNGSLWTMGVMVQTYIVLWFLHKVLHNRKASFWVIVNIILTGLSFTPHFVEMTMPEIIYKLYLQTFLPYLWLFVLGATLSEFFESLILFLKKYWYVFAGAAMLVVINDWNIGGSYNLLKCIPMALAIIGFAYRYPKIHLKYDLSYGIYIYHMIVINVMVHLGYTGNIPYAFVAFISSLLLAVLSYTTVGTLGRKKRQNL